MQRYNGFTLIHKALRAMLYDASLSIQQTWFANIEEAETPLEKIESVLYTFEQHAHHEDHFILPAIEQFEPELVHSFEEEHVTDVLLGNRLKNLLNIYRHMNFTEERLEVGSAITKAFVEFMVFNLEHMAKEELLLNPALWEHYTDEQLVALNQKLVASIPKEEVAATARWMMRGINNIDAINWLKAVKKNAPSFVLQSLLQLAEDELPEHRRSIILEAVNGDAVMA